MPGAAASFYGGGDGLTVLKKVWSKLREGYLKEMLQELGWIDQYARRYRGQILLYMVLGLAAASLGLGGSLLSRELTSAVVEARGPWRDVLLLAGLYILLGLASIGLGAVNSRISARINLKIQNEMQADLFRRFLRAEWQALLNYHSGDLLNRLTSDVSTVAASVFSLLPSLVIRLFQFAACLALILRYDPVMAGLALLSAPVTLGVSRILVGKMRGHQKQVRAVSSDLMAFHEETLQNLQSIKAFNLIEPFSRRLLGVQRRYQEASLEFNQFSIVISSFLSLVGQAVSYTCLAWGVYRLWTGRIDLALMVMFLQLAGQLSASFSVLVGLVPGAISATVSAGRILAVLDLPAEPEAEPEVTAQVERMQAAAGRTGLTIRLENICFGYRPEEPVLREITLTARPGEIVALMGASGDGKTTLLRLLLSLVRPQTGKGYIAAEGELPLPLTPAARPLFSYVPQEKAVFSGTIADSMRMLRPEATDEEIMAALKIACADTFVSRLPEGIHTVLGEQGAGLSEGQNQRLSIARALVRNAPILLLDEATSALDVETERQVLQNLLTDAPRRTCVVTSHRPTVFSLCSHVYRIRDTRLEEVTAEELESRYGTRYRKGQNTVRP